MTRQLLEQLADFSLGDGRFVAVFRFARRYFVVRGHQKAPRETWLVVAGPFETAAEAIERAQLMQKRRLAREAV
jgi:hypothetical protein